MNAEWCTVWILCGAGLAGHLYVGECRESACTAGDGHAHSFGYVGEMPGVDSRIVSGDKILGHHSVFDLLDHVGCDEPSTVGYSGAQIGNLHGSGEDFALTDGYGYDGVGTPPALTVDLVVEFGVGYESAALSGQVGAEPVAVAERHEMFLPCFECFGRCAVLRQPIAPWP